MGVSKQQVKMIPASELFFEPVSYVERLAWEKVFGKPGSVQVEIGSGDGSFLVQWASLHQDVNFLGIERLLGRARKTSRKANRQRLQNIRLMRIEAAYFVEYLTPPSSVSAFHIYFPDPWPKRKQRKNRLIEARFVEALANALEPAGTVYLRTDDRDYFEQMQDRFGKSPRFRSTITHPELENVLTDFERGFLARNVSTLRAAYERTGAVTHQ